MESLQPTTLAEMMSLAEVFKRSGFFRDIRDEAQAVTKILYGRELGFSPIVSIMSVYIVDGKPCLSANLLGAMVKRSGKYNYRVKSSTNTECILEFIEQGQVVGEQSFNMEDAKMASLLTKDNWRKYPKSMLFARCLSAGVRTYCPDISACPLYVPEEMGATVNADGDVIEPPVPISAVPVVIERPAALPATTVATASSSTVSFVPAPMPKMSTDAPQPVRETPVKPVVDEDDFITTRQQGQLAQRFRESLREELQGMAEELRHNALAFFGYVDKDGNPSSTLIKVKDFKVVGVKMVDYAKGL